MEGVHANRRPDLVGIDAARCTTPAALPAQVTKERVVHVHSVLPGRCGGNATYRPPLSHPPPLQPAAACAVGSVSD